LTYQIQGTGKFKPLDHVEEKKNFQDKAALFLDLTLK
jgi:hypothetical protein